MEAVTVYSAEDSERDDTDVHNVDTDTTDVHSDETSEINIEIESCETTVIDKAKNHQLEYIGQ